MGRDGNSQGLNNMAEYSPVDSAFNIYGEVIPDRGDRMNDKKIGTLWQEMEALKLEHQTEMHQQVMDAVAKQQAQTPIDLAIAIINSGAFNRDDTTMTGERYGEAIVTAVKTIQEGLKDETNLE